MMILMVVEVNLMVDGMVDDVHLTVDSMMVMVDKVVLIVFYILFTQMQQFSIHF
jgi:hypothetical protein